MEGEKGDTRGGSVGDMRTLHYWSRVSFYFLVVGGAAWAALGLLRLYQGLSWYQTDELTGSTRAVSDLSWGVACIALAVLSFFIAGRLQLDIVAVFRQMRFQVPREKLAVYGLLGFPLGLVVSGVLLVLVNFKLSHPEFLPSHAEAYPEVFYAARPPPPAEEAVAAEGVAAAPTTATQMTEPLVEVGPPPTLVYAPPPLPAAAEPIPAIYEEVDAGPVAVPSVPSVPSAPPQAAPGEAPPLAAAYEEVPSPGAAPPPEGPAPAVPVVEEAPAQLEAFEEVEPPAPAQGQPEEAAAPKDIKSAHEELMRKLLGK